MEWKEILSQYGLAGIVIAVLAWTVRYLYLESKEDRKNWNKTVEGNTDALKELRRFLENKK